MAASLTAADFISLRLQYKNEKAQGEYPCAIEHLFEQGVMVDHYFVVPTPALLQDADVQALGGVSGLLFCQQPEGAPWLVHLHEITMLREVCFEMPDAELRALLRANAVRLPGEA